MGETKGGTRINDVAQDVVFRARLNLTGVMVCGGMSDVNSRVHTTNTLSEKARSGAENGCCRGLVSCMHAG